MYIVFFLSLLVFILSIKWLIQTKNREVRVLVHVQKGRGLFISGLIVISLGKRFPLILGAQLFYKLIFSLLSHSPQKILVAFFVISNYNATG